MYIPAAPTPGLLNDRSTITPSHFSLDPLGVASLLGGDDTITAMTTAHVYENRRWLGWYNVPGSFQIATRLNSFARSASFHDISESSGNLSPESLHTRSVHVDPATLFELDSYKGPKFHAAHSGTVTEETSYLATLFMKMCATLGPEGRVVPGRWMQPVGITIADLSPALTSEVRPAHSSTFTSLFASIPTIISVGTCVLCTIRNDLYASLRILIGIVASSVFCLVLGSADFVFTCPEPVNGSPVGDGIFTSDEDIVLVRGTEGAVNSITRGRFSLRLSCEGHYNLIRLCSVLYFIQGITQLFLIPQASLFGQIMFLTSLAVSALHNTWLASLNKEQGLGRILFDRVLGNPTLIKYTFGSRITAVVFMLLILQPQDPTRLLNELLPEDTMVWRMWKATILDWLRHPDDQSFRLRGILGDLNEFTQQEKDLLEWLYEDVQAAYNGYSNFLRVDSQ